MLLAVLATMVPTALMVMRETVLLRASKGKPVRCVEAALMAILSLTCMAMTSLI